MSIEENTEIELPPVKEEINRVDDTRFKKNLEVVIKESEEIRLKRMRQHRTRGFIAINMSILFVLAGSAASGYYFLMEAELFIAAGALASSFIPVLLIHYWAGRPIKAYLREHKTIFMPKLAKALNGLAYHPSRGVSSKIINKLAVIPAYDEYKAEDCFMGKYKGVKVLFSEARLYAKKRRDEPLFHGLFVLLEAPAEAIEGHTIITSNLRMMKAYKTTRWKSLQQVHISVSDPAWDKFHVFSNKPEAAELMVGDRLLKELSEAGTIFDDAELTAVLFGKKYVFLMIPYEHDMFEASNLFVPVTTKSQAMKCKKEIEQLLEIIDVFDLYRPVETA